jgi:hypothetical protein
MQFRFDFLFRACLLAAPLTGQTAAPLALT